jgi:hypothetical protein
MRALPTWPVAAGSLLLGFGVALATDVRALGGLVLFAAALWCGLRWRRAHGLPRACALVGAYLAGFVAAHPLGHAIGAWPAGALAAAFVGVVAWRAGGDRGRPADRAACS